MKKNFMRLALNLARKGRGTASPNPMVGAVLVKGGKIIGRGWHHRPGCPHGEIEALLDARKRGHSPKGATLYVILEPCSTHGRTPPCTDAIIEAGVKSVFVGATDPNPKHRGHGFKLLKRARIKVQHGILAAECERLNQSFNHWIVTRMPLVVVKAAMTLDGKIATATGESKWITGEKARARGMELRREADAILVGINTVLADNPSLTFRPAGAVAKGKVLRRIILDTRARTPLSAKVVTDDQRHLTTIVVGRSAAKAKVTALKKKVRVLVAPLKKGAIDLHWLLKKLGSENVASLLVEGGGEVNASFLLGNLAHRVVFFYAPKILGGRDSLKAIGGPGAANLNEALKLSNIQWQKVGDDLMLSADVER